ncbi:dephospho-CoA kinase [Mucilaginibacter ginkgonis]|uniref:Dephospho-CoA kinase n=1 Tax=Mucilaginibacter ginkgonis TaxID=2682091 RepID=A0A7T7FCE0_9SPHI|nr:dephospho-CoA kinase [Mucilaginibacter ginkgonis]QQL50777.1 dephospho-CoA kinase [Mucilaginibacter ginkgonis]
MLKIGLTGNIGSGKTTVSKIFALLGVPVFYADESAKNVMTADVVLIQAITNTFGKESYFDDGSLNRKHIAAQVFSDPEALQRLNAIVHPAVFRDFDNWVTLQQVSYVIKEAAILFESGSYLHCDKSIIVTAPLDLRLQRTIARDGITLDEAKARDSRQKPENEKTKLADFFIVNDDTQMVIPQVLALHNRLLALASA